MAPNGFSLLVLVTLPTQANQAKAQLKLELHALFWELIAYVYYRDTPRFL
jgi:hypothetical protein